MPMTDTKNQESEKLLSRDQLAERWGKSTRTIKRWDEEGRIKALALGPRTIRYRLSDILKFEQAAEVTN